MLQPKWFIKNITINNKNIVHSCFIVRNCCCRVIKTLNGKITTKIKYVSNNFAFVNVANINRFMTVDDFLIYNQSVSKVFNIYSLYFRVPS